MKILPLLLLLALPAVVQAQYNYTTNNGTITITKYTGPGGAVTIPGTITGLSVTSIGYQAFINCTSLASVTIPDTVTSLGDAAFNGCTGLTSVTIGNSVTSIGSYEFYNCTSLKGVTIGNSVTSIGYRAFFYCTSLKGVTIPDNVTSIGEQAFNGCTGLTSVTIGNGVTSIGVNAFVNCTGLASVTIPDSVTSIRDNAFSGCTGLASVAIGNRVTSIGYQAFINCTSLKGVTIPDSVTSLGDDAFDGCTGLTSVTIGNSVISIGTYVFYNCTSLKGVTIGNSVTSIGYRAFFYCTSLKGVTIPDNVTSIGEQAFNGCTGLTNVMIGNGVTSIGVNAFVNCTSLASVTIGNSVTSIRDSAFSGCTRLASVTIPDSVTSIGNSAFAGCTRLASVTIGNGVTSIGSQAFINCTSLANLTIGNNVTSIGDSAFEGCISLTGVTIPDNVTSIGSYAFNGCTRLASVTIGNSLTSIGYRAFINCTGLTSVTIGNSVTSIGVSAFNGCTSLASVTIPDSVTSIGNYAFYNCTSLTGIYFKGIAPDIGSSVFGGDNNATIYYLPGTAGWDDATFGGRPTALWIVVVLNPSSLNQVYDGSPKVVMAVTTPPGLALTITYNGSAAPPTGAGSYAVVATVSDPNASASGTLTVLPAPLTVTGVAGVTKVYDRTTSATIDTAGATLNGVLAADMGNVTLVTSGATGAFADKAVGNNKPVTVSGLTLGGSAAGNYTLTQPTLTANITPAGLAISGLAANSKAYDGTTAATLSGTAALSGVIGSDTVSLSGTAAGVFGDKAVGNNKPVTVSGLSLSGTDAVNYTLTQPALTANITPAGLTISGLAANGKVYDGTTAATLTGTPVPMGVIGTDVVSANGTATGTFGDKAVGTGKSVAVSGLTLAGTDAGNYTLTQPTLTANITPAGLAISGLAANSKAYDGTTAATLTGTPVATGMFGSDSVSLTGTATSAFASKSVGTGKSVAVSGLTLAGTDAGNYTLTQPTLTANITPAGLAISGLAANSKAYDGTTAATFTGTPVPTGVIGTDAVSVSGAVAGVFADKAVGNNKPVTVSGLSLSGTDAGNYTLTQPALTADITPARLTITGLAANSKAYDGTMAATLTGTAVATGVFGSDAVSVNGTATSAFADKSVGTGKTVVVSGLTLAGTDAGNYALIQPTLMANITPARLTITGLAADSKVYDGTTPATLTGTPGLSGVIGSESVSLTGTATSAFADKNVGTDKNVAVSGLTLAGTDAGNYTLTQPTLTANITPAGLAISGLAASNKVYDGTTAATVTGTPALSGFIGSDTVSVNGIASGVFASKSVGTSKSVSVSGLALAGTNAGNYTLTQPRLTANITPAGLAISGLAASNKVYDGTTAATLTGTPALSGVIGSDAVSVNGTATGVFASKSVGTGRSVAVSGLALAGTDAGNYTLAQPSLSANITLAGLTITGLAVNNKVYDGTTAATPTGTPALAAVIGSDSVSLSGTARGAFASKSVGTGKSIAVSGLALAGIDAGNYTLTPPTPTADITPKGLTVIGLASNSKVYDGTTAATLAGTPGLSGVIAGDVVSVNGTAAGVFADKVTGMGKRVAVSGLSLSGADAGNYSLTQPALTANITPAGLTITGLTANSKVYDGTASATLTGTPGLSGVIGGDSVSLSGTATGAFGSKTVGTSRSIAVSGLALAGTDAGNYTLTQPTLTANITPAGLTINGLAVNSKVYDGTTAATLTGTPALSGVIGSDAVSVSGTATGAFASRTVGTGKSVAVSGLALAGTDAGNYTLTQPTRTAEITPKGLTLIGLSAYSKVYDGTTSATLTGTPGLSGVVAGDVVSVSGTAVGVFASKSVGTGKLVTISGLTLSGSAAANYALIQPTTTANILDTPPPTVAKPALVGQAFSVSVSTVLGANYTLEYKNAFTDTVWTTVQTLAGTGGTITLTDGTATNPTRFYRIRFEYE